MTTDAIAICPFCSMGCTWRLVRDAGTRYRAEAPVAALDYTAGGGPNRGSLCGKGNMALELLTHPNRLETPLLRLAGESRAAGWDEALGHVVRRLGEIRARHGGRSVGLLLGSGASSEEAAAAARLARAIGTPHLDLCAPADHALTRGLELAGARPARVENVEQIDAMRAVLVVGDLFTLAPCAAKPVLDARYRDRRHTVAVLAPTRTRTAWFGRPFLRCDVNGEAAALAAMLALALERAQEPAPAWAAEARAALARWPLPDLARRSGVALERAAALAAALAGEGEAGVLLASEFGARARLDLVAALAAMLAEATGARFLAMLEGPNSAGVRAVLRAEGFPGADGHTMPELLEAVVRGDVKALLVFGSDPVAVSPGSLAARAMASAALTVVTAALPGPAVETAEVVLPAAVIGEKAGTVLPALGPSVAMAPVMPPPGWARPDLQVLAALAAALAPDGGAAGVRGGEEPLAARELFAELDLFLRAEGREEVAVEPGELQLLAEASATNAAEGLHTAQLSWARYAHPEARLTVSPALASALGVRAGDRVRVRSNWGQAELAVRLDAGLPEGVVTAPHRDPAVRGLLSWRREPMMRSLDLRPDRVHVEPLGEVGGA